MRVTISTIIYLKSCRLTRSVIFVKIIPFCRYISRNIFFSTIILVTQRHNGLTFTKIVTANRARTANTHRNSEHKEEEYIFHVNLLVFYAMYCLMTAYKMPKRVAIIIYMIKVRLCLMEENRNISWNASIMLMTNMRAEDFNTKTRFLIVYPCSIIKKMFSHSHKTLTPSPPLPLIWIKTFIFYCVQRNGRNSFH
jgi:hypothetical protein